MLNSFYSLINLTRKSAYFVLTGVFLLLYSFTLLSLPSVFARHRLPEKLWGAALSRSGRTFNVGDGPEAASTFSKCQILTATPSSTPPAWMSARRPLEWTLCPRIAETFPADYLQLPAGVTEVSRCLLCGAVPRQKSAAHIYNAEPASLKTSHLRPVGACHQF